VRVYLAFCIGYTGECGKPLIEIGCTQIEDRRVEDFLKAFCEILGDGEVLVSKRYGYYPEWSDVEEVFKEALGV